MRYSELKQILKQHDLRVTDCRMDILGYFLSRKSALTAKNLEDAFHEYDRVTLYRTLGSFTDQGVLHKIPDDSGQIAYGVCHQTCASGEHHHNHLHFKCKECGSVECVDQPLPTVELPGYKIQEANLILTGTCKSCVEN